VKLELIARLANAGLRDIEATAFISPKWVPQILTRGYRAPGACAPTACFMPRGGAAAFLHDLGNFPERARAGLPAVARVYNHGPRRPWRDALSVMEDWHDHLSSFEGRRAG
jgi:hypothetical protein